MMQPCLESSCLIEAGRKHGERRADSTNIFTDTTDVQISEPQATLGRCSASVVIEGVKSMKARQGG
jgi:hypothetical protein